MKKIKWGIIGPGNIATKFATDLATIEDAELYAVASRTKENAENFAQKFNASKSYASYEDLVKDSNVDAIYIATPHSFHYEHSLLCLKHNKAVLCEKPFAMNKEEVEEMISCAKQNNSLLMEALWTYFLPHYKYVLQQIRTNALGKLLKLKADFGFKAELHPEHRLYKKSLGGGSLLDIGIYPIFAALSTLGYPRTIESKATFLDNGVDGSCIMLFGYPNGVTAELKSTIENDTPTTATFEFENGKIVINSKFHIPTTVTVFQNGNEETLDFDCKTFGYSYEIIHFNQLIRDGIKESPVMTFDFSRQLISLLDTVRTQIGLHY